jgi:hypothetical protein
VHPAQALANAQQAAKAAAARKAERAPRKLTEAEVQLLPGKKVLELGNAGHLRHLGVGTVPRKSAAPAGAPRTAASRSARVPLTDTQLKDMPGEAISKAMDAGMVAGVGPRRRGRRR